MARSKVSRFEIWIIFFVFVFSGVNTLLKAESLRLLWDKNSESDLKGYKIYYGTAAGNYSKTVDVGKIATYTVNNLNASTTYYFVLTAYDSAGNESQYSKEVSGTTRAVDSTPPTIQLCRINSASQIDVTFSEAVTKESAETVTNYTINKSIQVLKAQLDASQTKLVHLTTSLHQVEGDYTLTINDIKDLYNPPNTIVANSTVIYNFILPDTTRPTITNLEVLNPTQLQLTFSEKVKRTLAQTIKNYAISNGMTISSALLENDEKRVTLTTSEHPNNREYVLTVNNITDLAATANVIKPNTTINYVVGKLDKEPPQIVSVRLVDLTHVEINYSEKVTKITAEDAENYQINDGIQIISASLGSDEQRLTLTTTQHAYNHRYTIVMNGVQDLAYPPNSIPTNSSKTYILEQADIVPPTIARVELLTPSLVEIVFSEPVTNASAETIQNYSISDGIVVQLAKLQGDNKTVYLNTSEHQMGQIYTITISNIKDRSSNGNVILPNSRTTYFKEAVDVTPPVLEKILPISMTEIKVEFSEPITQESAENKSNYSIDPDVEVLSAKLQAELKSVILTTSAHTGNRNYTLTINNITDRAKSPNLIAAGSQLAYFMEAPDSDAPKISSINKKSLTEIELVFTEALEKTSAELIRNYSINNEIKIESAKLDESGAKVILTTNLHTRGKIYSISVNNVRDKANPPNVIAPNSVMNYIFEIIDSEPPRIEAVHVLDSKKVEIAFSEQVTRESAENIANYQINNGIEIVSATLLDNLKAVWLTTSTHDAGVTYRITINNIQDRATPANSIALNSQQTYILHEIDSTPPQITSVEILSATKVDVLFSEPVEEISAEKLINYSIDKGIQIINAELDANMRLVHLTTSEHGRGTNYSITINRIFDRASTPNEIVVNSVASYYFKIVDMLSPEISIFRINSETEIEITFTEPLDKISAETVTNYSIDKGIQVQKATLQVDNLVVILKTSPHQRGELYTITLNKIYDRAVVPNEIKQNSSYSYSLQIVDTMKPTIVAVSLESETVVKIVFSEEIDKTTAENTNNYYINNGIFISSVRLLADYKTVRIQTSAHKRGRDYLIQVSRIKDLAIPPNEILPNSSFSYYFETIDQEGPTVLGVKVYSDVHLEVIFNEQVDHLSAEKTTNYFINRGIEVQEAHVENNLTSVSLKTSPHTPGTMYTIQLNNILDRAEMPNPILPNTSFNYFLESVDNAAPVLDSVKIVAENQVVAYFNEALEQSVAETKENFTIDNGIQIISVKLDQNQRVVHLKTSRHTRGRSYRLMVNKLLDLATPPNVIQSNTNKTYFFEAVDTTPPQILSVKLMDPKMVYVEFSEKIDMLTAVQIENFKISNDIEVLTASLDSSRSGVFLTTTQHIERGRYIITVSNIKDLAVNPNIIKQKSAFSYLYQANWFLKNVSLNHYLVDSLEVGDKYYIDRAYKLTNLSNETDNSLWLMTANTDRWRTDERFLSFQVETNVRIYIGYDSRALTVPYWLEQNYKKTNQVIDVSDLSHQYIIWERIQPAGEIVLGGNLASGGNGAKAMYMVLVQEIKDEEEMKNNLTVLPENFKLYQNYPNPFNGGTQIRFDLPQKNRVKLIIYNILGQEVRVLTDELLEAGKYNIHWDATDEFGTHIANGVYLASLQISPVDKEKFGGQSIVYNEVKKLLYLK